MFLCKVGIFLWRIFFVRTAWACFFHLPCLDWGLCSLLYLFSDMLAYCTLIPCECAVERKADFVRACLLEVSISGFEGTNIAAGFWSVFLEIGFR